MTITDTNVPKINVQIDGPLGWVLINSPDKLNSLNEDMWASLPDIIKELDQNKDIRAIIFRGVGEKAFSAGADISEFDRVREGDAAKRYNKLNTDCFKTIQDCITPTISMVHGFCLGGGFLIALSTDLRLASTKAQFSLPPAKLGIGFDVRWLSPLLKIVTPPVAKELLFTGARFSATDCMEKGLLTSVHEPDELEDAVIELASTIGGNAPLTLHNVKSAIDALAQNEAQVDFAAQDELTARCFNSKDYQEGRKAFAERRKPEFTGE